jgi:hypothetical protein
MHFRRDISAGPWLKVREGREKSAGPLARRILLFLNENCYAV